ncbi:arylamine N-acetyltransferase [Streptomyces sp. NPDC048251]|uniref:arylamine N-acetyltransferase n=1 Tax=unclassified Streptomyces TaxID=2593676 RepID=UPI003248CB2F
MKEGDDVFDVGKYLQRIGWSGEAGVDIATLRALHKKHLMAIPYNGAGQDLRNGIRLVDLDENALFETSIVNRQGGTCFELARLFHRLLGELGYDVTLMAGSTAEGRENFGLDVEHMLNRVALDGAEWLVDVGYPGPSFIEPLLVTDSVQTQYGCQYRLVDHESGFALQRRGRVSRWSVVYTFTRKARQWSDWQELEDRLNREFASDGSEACPIARGTDRLFREIEADTRAYDGQDVLCGRTFDDGQIVLKGRRYLTVRDGREEVHTITDDGEHRKLVSRILSGEFS